MFPGYDDVPCGLITKEAVTALKRHSCEESSGERNLPYRSTWKQIPGAKCFGLEALFSWLWAKHKSEAKRRVTSVLSIILWSLFYTEDPFGWKLELDIARISSKKVLSCHQRFISIQNASIRKNCVNRWCCAPLSSVLLCLGRTVHPPLLWDNSHSDHCNVIAGDNREWGPV